ncbi:MAG: hypothetical protein K2G32_08410, partial [Oscillospiraceae bacterium]|nr:hypothetical protein [Oscillospiraceae bacterium]
DYIHPEVVTFVEGKFAGERKWTITWDEQVYDMLLELRNPAKFEFNFDDCYGFSTELSQTVIGNMLNDVAFHGESWAQLSNTNSPIVDGIISELK